MLSGCKGSYNFLGLHISPLQNEALASFATNVLHCSKGLLIVALHALACQLSRIANNGDEADSGRHSGRGIEVRRVRLYLNHRFSALGNSWLKPPGYSLLLYSLCANSIPNIDLPILSKRETKWETNSDSPKQWKQKHLGKQLPCLLHTSESGRSTVE